VITLASVEQYRVLVAEVGPARLRLQVAGEVDLLVAPQLLDSILCAGISAERTTVVVDLAMVTFMDSSGLGALLEAQRRLPGIGCELVILHVPEVVQRVITAAGVGAALNIRRVDPDGAADSREPSSSV
jgi:anti-sigma B factor antagonist